MTDIGESVAVTTIADSSEEEIKYHYAGVSLVYPNGKPYTDPVYVLATVNGDEIPNQTNFEGVCINPMLDEGSSVEYEISEQVDDEITKTRAEIKHALDDLLEDEKAQQKRENAELSNSENWEKPLIITGAFMTGVADGAWGIVEFAGDVLELGGKAIWYNLQSQANILETAWEKYVEGDKKAFFESVEEKNIEDFAKIFGATPQQIREAMAEAYEMMNFIMEDAETRDMLLEFAEEYAKSQSVTEYTEIAGSVVFDILLAVVLALFTGGAGNAAQVATKMRHVGKLQKLGQKLRKLTNLLKKKKLNQKVNGKLDEKIEVKIELPEKQKIEVNEPKDSAFERKKDKKQDTDNTDANSKDNNADSSDSQSGSKSDTATDESGQTKSGDNAPDNSKTRTDGEPISLVTGEELLPLTDFMLKGALPLKWERTYRSSNPDNIGVGHGWTHSFSEHLELKGSKVELHDAEGRVIPFNLPAIGKNSKNTAEKLNLYRASLHSFILTSTSPGIKIGRCFDPQYSNTTLPLSQIRDPFGSGYRFHYFEDKLDRIEAMNGDAWKLDYTERGLITSVHWHTQSGQMKCMVRYDYDKNDDLIKATDAVGNSEHYAYDNHIIRQRKLKSGYNFYFQWDSNTPKARCLRQWGDKINGKPTYDYKFKWDQENKRVAVTDTRGAVQVHQFNDRGLPIYHRDAEGAEFRYQYDSVGNMIAAINAEGHSERFAYNLSNELVAVTDVQNHKQQFVRDEKDNIVTVIDALQAQWKSSYNQHNQVITQTNPNGETYKYQYNQLGLINSITNPLGLRWHYIWDNNARLSAVRNPEGEHTRYHYNEFGQLQTITWPNNQKTEYRYDANDNCCAIHSPDGNVEQYTYNELGLLTQHSDSIGRVTQYQYNGLSQVVRRIDPLGQKLDYHYDGERNLIGLTNENKEHYHLSYDLNARLVQEVGFDGRVLRYTYDKLGHLIASEDLSPDGKHYLNQIRYKRDLNGRLLEQWDAINKVKLSEYAYDDRGNILLAANAARKLQWRYDTAGRVTEDWQDKHVLKHEYDSIGQRIATLLPDGNRIKANYTSGGQLADMHFNDELVASITRDQMGRELKREHANQLLSETRYDPQGRLIAQRTGKLKHDTFQSISLRHFHYNSQGQLSQVDDQIRGTTHYQYDALDRLISVDGPSPEKFVHDPAGNILASEMDQPANSAQIDGNRLAFHGDAHFQYDDKGNRIAQASGKGHSLKTSYHYNALNQLEEVNSNGLRTRYTYDALGRRCVKGNDQERTDFLWLDNVLLKEYKQNAQGQKQQKTYLFEPNSFKPLAFIEDDECYHYHLDHLGTPQEITNSQGEIVWAVSYKAYGNLALAYENRIENNLRFQGQYFDSETGLHYNRFRYYDPSCGRFINQDPIGLWGGTNNYLYAPNPISWIDPFGLNNVQTGAGRDHVTYRATTPDGKFYTGYASAPSNQGLSPDEIVSRRYSGDYSKFGGQAPEVVYSGSGVEGKQTARGLEQHYYEQDLKNPNIGKDKIANGQNPVGPNNPNKDKYKEAANKHLDKQNATSSKGECG